MNNQEFLSKKKNDYSVREIYHMSLAMSSIKNDPRNYPPQGENSSDNETSSTNSKEKIFLSI